MTDEKRKKEKKRDSRHLQRLTEDPVLIKLSTDFINGKRTRSCIALHVLSPVCIFTYKDCDINSTYVLLNV